MMMSEGSGMGLAKSSTIGCILSFSPLRLEIKAIGLYLDRHSQIVALCFIQPVIGARVSLVTVFSGSGLSVPLYLASLKG